MWILACIVVAAGFPHLTCAGEDGVRGGREELASLFDTEILDDNVFHILQQSHRLTEDQRFEYLRSWVFSKRSKSLIRWSADHLPSGAADHHSSVDGHGGTIIAPALELIDVATSEQLDSLATFVSGLNPASDDQSKQKSAFLTLCYLKSQQQSLAEEQLRILVDLARRAPDGSPERMPELAVLYSVTASRMLNHGDGGAIRELAAELSVVLLDDVRSERFKRSERYKHHVSALKFRLDSNVLFVRPGMVSVAGNSSDGASPLKSWVSVSETNAEARGRGYPPPMWVASKGAIKHVSGHHNHDYVYYVSPLTGDFSVEADTTTFDLHDIHLAYSGIWAGAAWDGRSAVAGLFRHDAPNIPLDPPLTRMFDTMRVRLRINDQLRQTFVNGRLVHQNSLTEHLDPWLAIHSWWLTDGAVRDLRITGTPVVPETIDLITPALDGWTSYYNESVGWQNADWRTVTAESVEIHGVQRLDVPDSFCESLLRYHRPMIEDGTIEYDFFLQTNQPVTNQPVTSQLATNQSVTHPAIDRLCFILRPEGVYTHWATDGRYDRTTHGPDTLEFDQRSQRHAGMLPLIEGSWNHVAVSIRTPAGESRSQQFVEIALNGELVFSRRLEESNDRTFGLFHWADQSEVRVRNLRWSGSWPRTLPQLEQQELADLTLDQQLGDRNQLTEYLDYNFGRGIETGMVSIRGADWESNVVQEPDGLRLKRTGGHYVNYLIAAPLALSGDFDVVAEFEDLEIEAHPGGEGNIQLNLIVDDDRSSEYVLYRKHYVLENGVHEEILHASLAQKRGSEFQYTFFGAPAEESTSGRLRMVRRGTTIFFLYAERDSPHYRLVHRETITQDDVRVRLVNGHHKDGFTTVTWKSLNICAQAATGSLASPIRTVTQLDQERDALPARRTWNFGSSDPQLAWRNDLSEFGGIGTFTDGPLGLEINVPGSDDWKAAGLTSRQQISGDFDISLALEVLHIEPCAQYNESCVLLLTEFRDSKKSTIETKFSIHHAGDTKAETQIRRLRKDGEFDYQELVSQTSRAPAILRLARRGSTVYQIYQGTEHSQPLILGAVEMETEPVSSGNLRALIHTGGNNRKTIVRFQTLDVCASEIQ